MERKVAICVLVTVAALWSISVMLTFVNQGRVIDPLLHALMTTVVGGAIVYLYKVKNGDSAPS